MKIATVPPQAESMKFDRDMYLALASRGFFKKHPEFGKPVSFSILPDWAHGKRVSVVCRLGWFRKVTYILYERNGFIETVYRWDKKLLGTVKVFGTQEERVYE